MTTRRQGLSQYLNYLGLVAPGVVALADGAFLACWEYAGRDQQYLDHDLMHHEANQLGQELARLSNGWMLELHVIRVACVVHPQKHACHDATSAIVFEERQRQYSQLGTYYENRHVLALTYLPPGTIKRQARNFLFEDGKLGTVPPRQALLDGSIHDADEFMKALSSTLTLRQMNDGEVTHFLRYCVTGEDRAVGIAPDKGQINEAIGSIRWAPHSQQVGPLPTRVVGLIGWPAGTTPQMFEPILQLPFSLRLHQRFIALSTQDAVRELRNKQADWLQLNSYNPKRILWSFLAPLTGASADDRRVVAVNTDAENQALSVEREIEAVQSGSVQLGYFTMNVVVHDATEGQADAKAAQIMTMINRLGFTGIVETDNAADALRSSWSGHGSANIRKYSINTQQLARLLPTSFQWRGEDHAPNPYYPKGSGPLIITTSAGQTPFFLNIHERDLGNFCLIGKSGYGKSYAEGTIAMAFRQYQNAQINIFDNRAAQVIPTVACGGAYFDADMLRYAPLRRVDDEKERGWALRLIETMATLRNFAMTPQARHDVTLALERLGKGAVQYRTMTAFHAMLQTHVPGLKAALEFYTAGKGGRILDGEPGPEQENAWQTWDMQEILGQGEEISRPVIMFLLHEIDRRLDGRPTLNLFEEAWQVAADEWLQARTEEDSANNRKQVVAMGLVLHSPANLALWARRDLLLINMSTFIFLPDERAKTPEMSAHYAALGLGRREIKMLAEDLRPQRDYFQVQGEKRQVFQFDNGPFAHALLSKNGIDHKRRVLALREQFGEAWVPVWLAEQGHNELARHWQQRNRSKEAA